MRRKGEQRKAGGQSGHRGAGRELRPEDQVDEIVDHFLDACGGWGREFDAVQRRPGRRFGRTPAALWIFVTVHEIEPTNNPAERALRAPVIHRKISLGS